MSREPPLYLYIFNPNDTSCRACSQNSSDFYIRGKESPGSGEEKGPVKLGLGIGLGLGLPLLCVTVAVVWLWIRRRRRKAEGRDRESQAEPLRDWRQQPSPMSTDTYPTPGMHQDRDKQAAESGGYDVMELSPEQMISEAPREHEKVELEADPVVVLSRREALTHQ